MACAASPPSQLFPASTVHRTVRLFAIYGTPRPFGFSDAIGCPGSRFLCEGRYTVRIFTVVVRGLLLIKIHHDWVDALRHTSLRRPPSRVCPDGSVSPLAGTLTRNATYAEQRGALREN